MEFLMFITKLSSKIWTPNSEHWKIIISSVNICLLTYKIQIQGEIQDKHGHSYFYKKWAPKI